ncbi:MAG: SDR family NAD(P)-dependent oxidoreductase [Nevskiaceae bacterium]
MALKAALILGGSRGLGRDAARALAAAGWAVAVASRDLEACARVAAEIGAGARAFEVDVTDHASVVRCVTAVETHYGHIHAALANAGKILGAGPLDGIAQQDFAAAVALNMGGVFNAISAVVPALKRAGGGSLVINAAVSGLRGAAGIGAYSAAKAGGIMLAQVAAQEAGPFGVRVNVIAPGFIGTEAWMTKLGVQAEALSSRVPLRRIGRGEEIAATIAWLMSDASSYVSGAVIPIDGGMTAG